MFVSRPETDTQRSVSAGHTGSDNMTYRMTEERGGASLTPASQCSFLVVIADIHLHKLTKIETNKLEIDNK